MAKCGGGAWVLLWLKRAYTNIGPLAQKYVNLKTSSRRPAHSPQAQSRYKRLAGLLTCLALRCLPKDNILSDNMMS